MKHPFAKEIIRAYDIRGTFNKNLYSQDAKALGILFSDMLREKGLWRINVAYDGRKSSPILAAALVDGLLSRGTQVNLLGLAPTPLLYFAGYFLESDAGIMVTGSHNPPNDNGFKITVQNGPFFAGDLKELLAKEMAIEVDFGELNEVNIQDAYIKNLLNKIKLNKALKVVWDNSNGAYGEVLKKILPQLPGEHVLINGEIDGNFPAHAPDPTVEKNMTMLAAAVIDNKAHLGIAFDGDGDRMGCVDQEGKMLLGDQILSIFSMDLLAQHSGATIICDLKSSQNLLDVIAKHKGNAVLERSGHSFIKHSMKENNALLAGEMSGHFFFKDKYFGFDDGLYAALRLLEIVEKNTALTVTKSKYCATPEVRIAVDNKDQIIQEVLCNLQTAGHKENHDFITLDGIRFKSENGWWLIRPSQTEDLLSIRIEGINKKGLVAVKKEFAQFCPMLWPQLKSML